ncbi:MAG TPA: asparagine synthase (glutamine-hydrolyzing) [Chitinophagaceae bacterium]|nr:asparagine synthase (glutamine-hydrolyzing) [Chitinophagaceae bacterium]
MCGIAGIIQSDPSYFFTEHVKKMTNVLDHRGPDGEGHWVNSSNTALLGHRRLSIIDLTNAGDQPMHFFSITEHSNQPRYSIIHNGEIYNYIELREELEKKGYSFHSQTDTEVITAAYDHWQEDCLTRLDGMFAFAIWDEKKKELFAARDRFGEKPFFWNFQNNRFVFASEMKALWQAGISKSVNLKMLFNFITIGYTGNPENQQETFFENIQRLPAASYLKYSLLYSSYKIEKYWTLDPGIQNKKIGDNEAIETFTRLFNISVKRRLRSDVSIGTSLSGGLDSSSVIASALSVNDGQTLVNSFTASFPDYEKNELPYANEVARKFKLKQEVITITGNELMDDWDRLCYHQEEPFGSASIYAQYKVYELAKNNNTKVLLDGQGADEILAGYHKYYKWYWQELFRKGKLSGKKELTAARDLGIQEPFTWKNKVAAWFPSFASIVMEKRYLLHALQHEDLTKEFVHQQSKEAYYLPPDHFNLNGVLYFNTFVHGLGELLRFADRNSMAHGREVRLPFLSHELVEFIFSLPSHFKIRHGWTKWLLRESMKHKLPESIIWRRDKVGFEPPQKTWMQNKPIQDAIHDAKQKLVDEKVLKPEVMDHAVKPQASHDPGNHDWRYFSAASLFK